MADVHATKVSTMLSCSHRACLYEAHYCFGKQNALHSTKVSVKPKNLAIGYHSGAVHIKMNAYCLVGYSDVQL